jgi:hypothetical protein
VKVEVNLHRDDLAALQKHLIPAPRRPGLPGYAIVAVVFACMVMFLAPLFVVPFITSGADSEWFLLTAAMGWLSGALAVGTYKQVLVARQRNKFEERLKRLEKGPEVSIAPEGVTVRGKTFHAFYDWLYFPELVQTGDHLFLLMGGDEALIVPRQSFTTDQDFIHLAELCRGYFDRAGA